MKKKAQSSIEFMILLLFMLIVISLAVFVVGKLSVDLRDSQNAQERDEFANSIIKEFELAQNVESGYSRTITISPHLVTRFNVSFGNRYLVMRDYLVEGENSREFFYEIPGNVSYNYTVNESTNWGTLIIRNPKTSTEDLLIINSSNSYFTSS